MYTKLAVIEQSMKRQAKAGTGGGAGPAVRTTTRRDRENEDAIERLRGENEDLKRKVRVLREKLRAEEAKSKAAARRARAVGAAPGLRRVGRGGKSSRPASAGAPRALRSSSGVVVSEAAVTDVSDQLREAPLDDLLQAVARDTSAPPTTAAQHARVQGLINALRERVVSAERRLDVLSQEKAALQRQLELARHHGDESSRIATAKAAAAAAAAAAPVGGWVGGVSRDEIAALERDVKDKASQVVLWKNRFEQLDARSAAERDLHRRAAEALEDQNAQLRDANRQIHNLKGEVEGLRHRLQQFEDMEDDLRRERELKQTLEERLQKLCASPFISDSVETVEQAERLAELQKVDKQQKLQIAHMQKTLRGKHEELQRLRARNDELAKKEERLEHTVQQLRLGAMEQATGKADLQRKISLFTAGPGGVPSEELEKALALVKRRMENPSAEASRGKGGAGAEGDAVTEEDPAKLKTRLEKLQVNHLTLQRELQRAEQMLKAQSAINEDQSAEISELTAQLSEGAASLRQKLNDYKTLAEKRLARCTSLEAQVKQLMYDARRGRGRGGRGGASGAAGVEDGLGELGAKGSISEEHDDNLLGALSAEDSMESSMMSEDFGPGENVLEVWVVGAEIEPWALGTRDGTFLMLDFFNFETVTSPLAHGASPQYNFSSRYQIRMDSYVLSHFASSTINIEVNQARGADYERLGRAVVPLRDLLKPRGKMVNRRVPMRTSDGRIVGHLHLECKLALPVNELWSAYLKDHPEEAKKVREDAEESRIAEKAMERAAADLEGNTLCVTVVSGARLRHPSGSDEAPSPYVHYQLQGHPQVFTAVADRTRDPVFSATSSFEVRPTPRVLGGLRRTPLVFTVYDEGSPVVAAGRAGTSAALRESRASRAGGSDASAFGSVVGFAKLSLRELANGEPIDATLPVVSESGRRSGEITVRLRWTKPLVPADSGAPHVLTSAQFNAVASRFDSGGSGVRYTALLRALSLSNRVYDAVGRLREAVTMAERKALSSAVSAVAAASGHKRQSRSEQAAMGRSDAWEKALAAIAESRARRRGRLTSHETATALVGASVEVDKEDVNLLIAALEEAEGGDVADEREATAPVTDIVEFLRPISLDARVGEVKLREHLRAVRTGGGDPDATLTATDEDSSGRLGRAAFKSALTALGVEVRDEMADDRDPRAEPDWAEEPDSVARPADDATTTPKKTGLGEIAEDAAEEAAELRAADDGGAAGAKHDKQQDSLREKLDAVADSAASKRTSTPGAGTDAKDPYPRARPSKTPVGRDGQERSGSTGREKLEPVRPRGSSAPRDSPSETAGASGGAGGAVEDSGSAAKRSKRSPRSRSAASELTGTAAVLSAWRSLYSSLMGASGRLRSSDIDALVSALESGGDNEERLERAASRSPALAGVNGAELALLRRSFGSVAGVKSFVQGADAAPSAGFDAQRVRAAVTHAHEGDAATLLTAARVLRRKELHTTLRELEIRLGDEETAVADVFDLDCTDSVDAAGLLELIADVVTYERADACVDLVRADKEAQRAAQAIKKANRADYDDAFGSRVGDELSRAAFKAALEKSKPAPSRAVVDRLVSRFAPDRGEHADIKAFREFVRGATDGARSRHAAAKQATMTSKEEARLRARVANVCLAACNNAQIRDSASLTKAIFGRYVDCGALGGDPSGETLEAPVFVHAMVGGETPFLVSRREAYQIANKFGARSGEGPVKVGDVIDWAMGSAGKFLRVSDVDAHSGVLAGRLKKQPDWAAVLGEFEDAEHRGKISRRDFVKALEKVGFELSGAQRWAYMRRFDEAGTGWIEISQFHPKPSKTKKPKRPGSASRRSGSESDGGGASGGAGGARGASRKSKRSSRSRTPSDADADAAPGSGPGSEEINELEKRIRHQLRARARADTTFNPRRIFQKYDESHDGALSVFEFIDALRDMGVEGVSAELAGALITRFDKDSDNQVEYAEFLRIINPPRKRTKQEELDATVAAATWKMSEEFRRACEQTQRSAEDLFQELKSASGKFVTAKSLSQKAKKAVGMEISSSEARRMLRRLALEDHDGSDKWSLAEFTVFLNDPDYDSFESRLRGMVLRACAERGWLVEGGNLDVPFSEQDSNGDGTLSETQLARAFETLQLEPALSSADVHRIYARYDSGTGAEWRDIVKFLNDINTRFNRARAVLARLTEETSRLPEGAVKRAFEEADTSGMLALGDRELKSAFKALGVDLPSADRRALIECLDWDGNGQLDYTELMGGLHAARAAKALSPTAAASSSKAQKKSPPDEEKVEEDAAGGAGGGSRRPSSVKAGSDSDTGGPVGVFGDTASLPKELDPADCVVVDVMKVMGLPKSFHSAKVSVELTFFDGSKHKSDEVSAKKGQASLTFKRHFNCQRGSPGAKALVKALGESAERSASDLTFAVTDGRKGKTTPIGTAVVNVGDLIDTVSKDVTHHQAKIVDADGKGAGELVMGIKLWDIYQALVHNHVTPRSG